MKKFLEESAWSWVAYGLLALISGSLFVAFLVTGSCWPLVGAGAAFGVSVAMSEGLFRKEDDLEETSEE